MMFGIYRKQNGLQFIGVVADTEEEAINYVSNLCGSWVEYPSDEWTPDNRVYEKKYVPFYNTNIYVIKKIKKI